MEKLELELSPLPHTWIVDLDGTILKHNGYKEDGKDTLLAGAKDFINSIPKEDMIVIITSRLNKYRKITEDFLKENKIRYDYIIFQAPLGERILLNDEKPKGLKCAVSLNLKRNKFPKMNLKINENL